MKLIVGYLSNCPIESMIIANQKFFLKRIKNKSSSDLFILSTYRYTIIPEKDYTFCKYSTIIIYRYKYTLNSNIKIRLHCK